ncbi:hypothetical protein E7Z59_14915 [Robertkochia marina]|uniref:DUF6268 domain-containing protein n=1 Tax=Robertkochia marina TaxID=1227945 RepID=A0A4S3M001_9FLAO|nr:DUF6268 family outer membrane beta-barrel protein [Robertkochia marina]THD65869.1 hypothetical protein E7Z59_14915 [Robertkochia marina]TRZ41372.1 hypothetical protein D3A96_13525 [Robertkochia marina]
MKRILALIFIIGSVCFATAQETLDILSISGHFGTPQPFEAGSVYTGKTTERGVMVNLNVPIVLNEKQIWYNSVNYMQWNVNNDIEMTDEIANPIQVYGLILRTGLIQKLSNGNAIQVVFMPRLMTDLNNIDHKHFQIGGTFIYEKIVHQRLKIGYGVLYNQEVSGPNVTPLLNLEWKISDRWSVSGLLPISSKVKYNVNERLNLGLHHFGLLTTYRLGEEAYQNDYIERRSIDLGLFVRYKLVGGIHIEGRYGYSFGRSYGQYREDDKFDLALPLVTIGDDRTQVNKNADFKNGAYVNVRLVYAIKL